MVSKRHHQIHKAAILDPPLNLAAQDVAVDAVEELANVELERVAVARNGLQCSLGVGGRLVRAVSGSAGERLLNEAPIEDRPGHGINGVLNDQIAEGRSEDAARLRLIDHEAVVRTRAVGAGAQFMEQLVQIRRQSLLEIEAGPLAVLVPGSGMECSQQRLSGKGSLIEETDALHDARPSRPALPALPEKRKHSDFAVEQTTRRKASPLIPLRSCDP